MLRERLMVDQVYLTKRNEHANAVMVLHVTPPKNIEEVFAEDSVHSGTVTRTTFLRLARSRQFLH